MSKIDDEEALARRLVASAVIKECIDHERSWTHGERWMLENSLRRVGERQGVSKADVAALVRIRDRLKPPAILPVAE